MGVSRSEGRKQVVKGYHTQCCQSEGNHPGVTTSYRSSDNSYDDGECSQRKWEYF